MDPQQDSGNKFESDSCVADACAVCIVFRLHFGQARFPKRTLEHEIPGVGGLGLCQHLDGCPYKQWSMLELVDVPSLLHERECSRLTCIVVPAKHNTC
eukprot:5842157-Amphidinium_carterae.1